MGENKTKPTKVSVEAFLGTVGDARRSEALVLIDLMHEITGEGPVLWGPSIIGFGSQHYTYDTGREGDMARLGFSPRKSAITIYFPEGFGRYAGELAKLGKHKQSVSCLYINKLIDVDLAILRTILERSATVSANEHTKIVDVDSYIAHVPPVARPKFDELRQLAQKSLPNSTEVFSYGIVGYKIDDKRARVFISGWKDHVAVYPIPKNESLRLKLQPYIKGKGTLWFPLDVPLPKEVIKQAMLALAA